VVRKRAVLIDVDYKVSNGKALVRLLLKGKRFFRLYDEYEPYFYVDAPKAAEKEIMAAKANSREKEVAPTRCERVKMNVLGKEKEIWKVYCELPYDVPHISGLIAKSYPVYENTIPFGRRYMIDKGLAPFMQLTYEREGKMLKKILKKEEAAPRLRTMSFDIETYNPKGTPRPEKDEVIMISYEFEGERKVITSKKIDRDFVVACKDEREMIAKFLEIVKEKDVEVLLGYNSAVFDLPYLKARAEANGLEFAIGRDGSSFRLQKKGMREAAEITGRIHIDLYPVVRFMGFIGAFRISKYSLENAYEELTGKKKLMVGKLDIWKMWDDKNLAGELADYSRFDAAATMEIGNLLLPLLMEMGRLTRLPLFDVAGATAGQLVESLLIQKSFEHGVVVPNKPIDSVAAERELEPIKGAFVKLPQPGIYENLSVFDFRGLYPSIITSHNIDPFTVNPPKSVPDSECYISPNGHRFAKKPRGLIPLVLEELISMRAKIKKQLKGADKDSKEYGALFARAQSLKILANSYYGYLAYARSRWYSRECAESVTAWGRHYIQETIDKAIRAGFEVLYGDSLPPDRKIIVMEPSGAVKIACIGEFVEEHKKDAASYKTLAFDGRKLVFARIKRAIAHHYPAGKGGLLEIATSRGRTAVTPQHSVYKYEGGIKLADARELKKGDFLISLTNAPAPEIYKEGHVFDVARMPLGPISRELRLYEGKLGSMAKKGACPYCGNFAFVETKNAKGWRIPRYWALTKELAWLLGFFAAEGSSSKNLEMIGSFGKRIGKAMHLQQRALTALFAYGFGLGKGSCGKRVPDFILNAEEKLRAAFLEGYFEGSGAKCRDPRHKAHFQKISTKSPELAIGLQYLFKSLPSRQKNAFGKRIEHVYWRYRKGKRGIIELRFQAAKGRKFANFCLAEIKEIKPVRYAGAVYDLEVEGAHNFVDAEGLILVHNTDSIFLLLGSKKKEDALAFMKKVNDELPGGMELELEGFYPRGVFVTKKLAGEKETGAKKKYALIGEDGRIRIRGFELVRRDWSAIAKTTQRRVLEAILKHGSKEMAAKIVKEVIERLKGGSVPIEELAIYTQLRKDPGKYDVKSPELAAAQKAIARGMSIERGAVIGYVITRRGSSISEKAQLAEFAQDYDPAYYIDHQVLPAVLKILKELGYKEDDLKFKGEQKGLGSFF